MPTSPSKHTCAIPRIFKLRSAVSLPAASGQQKHAIAMVTNVACRPGSKAGSVQCIVTGSVQCVGTGAVQGMQQLAEGSMPSNYLASTPQSCLQKPGDTHLLIACPHCLPAGSFCMQPIYGCQSDAGGSGTWSVGCRAAEWQGTEVAWHETDRYTWLHVAPNQGKGVGKGWHSSAGISRQKIQGSAASEIP